MLRPIFTLCALTLASVAGGYAFALGSGHTGHLTLPDDVVPLTALALVYLLVSRGLLQIVGGLEVLHPDFAAAAADVAAARSLAEAEEPPEVPEAIIARACALGTSRWNGAPSTFGFGTSSQASSRSVRCSTSRTECRYSSSL